MKIFALFSVDNNYDQPDHNLVAWWSEKPSIEELAKALGLTFPATHDQETLFIVKVWSGEAEQNWLNTLYILREIEEGIVS